MIAQYFHYRIIETLPLTALIEFKDHRRLRVFYEKGCKCVNCGIEATQLALGEGRGQQHWDVYTDDFYPLTVDHIIPKSLGGSDNLDNLQPMCCLCNWEKGNGIWKAKRARPKYATPCQVPSSPNRLSLFRKIAKEDVLPGMIAYKKNSSKRVKEIGVIERFEINPHTNCLSIVVKDKPGSWFPLKSIYIRKSL